MLLHPPAIILPAVQWHLEARFVNLHLDADTPLGRTVRDYVQLSLYASDAMVEVGAAHWASVRTSLVSWLSSAVSASNAAFGEWQRLLPLAPIGAAIHGSNIRPPYNLLFTARPRPYRTELLYYQHPLSTESVSDWLTILRQAAPSD